jgi:hypothetical protein
MSHEASEVFDLVIGHLLSWQKTARELRQPTTSGALDVGNYGWPISEHMIEETAYAMLSRFVRDEVGWEDPRESMKKFALHGAVVRAFNRAGWLFPDQFGPDGWSYVRLECPECKAKVRVDRCYVIQRHYLPPEPTDLYPAAECAHSGARYTRVGDEEDP